MNKSIPMKWNNIIFIGFMGTGKSTLGRVLADKLGWDFVDTDHLIEQQEGLTIPQLFTKYGEAHFRTIESSVIEKVMQRKGQVISTGGGAVLAEINRLKMKDNGYVVALFASVETISRRLRGDNNRPLLQGKPEEVIPLMLERRKHAYDFADLHIHSDQLSIEQIITSLITAGRLS